MDTRLKADWIAALRSGKYKQGISQLRTKDNKFCCLGVLCVITNLSIDDDGINTVGEVDGNYRQIRQLLETDRSNTDELCERNDTGYTFPEIADYIEQNL